MKKNRNIRYLTREGIKNIGVNRLMSVASIAVLMSCLVLIGSAFLIFANVDSLLENIEAQNIINAYSDWEKDLSGEDRAIADQILADLETIDNISNVTFVPKELGLDKLKQNYTGTALEDIVGTDSDFLPDCFEITVSDMSRFSETVANVSGVANIVQVQENHSLATTLEKIRSAVTYLSLAIIAILLVVALFIIANTVRITMYSRRLEISIMKAVGATNSFIRWPFFVEGITIGLISAVISVGILYLLYFLASDSLLTIFGIVGNKLVDFMDYIVIISVGFVVISATTGGLGSMFSIRKYLKEQGTVTIDDN